EDLGTLPGDCGSLAWAINARGQVVGASHNCDTDVFEVVLWENGSITDLGVATPEPTNINDRGEIEGVALPPGCNDTDFCPARVFLLVPCHGSDECVDALAVRTYPTNVSVDSRGTRESSAQRQRLARRHHVAAPRTPRH